jgi:predicted flap endonuclease-1-like 5' DNA nuclease
MRASRTLFTLWAGASLLLLPSLASASPYPLDEILEKAPAEKLEKAGVKTSDELLAKGAQPKELRALAKATALPLAQLTSWTKLCDLVRIKGVGPEMVRLLNAGKITTVKQLRTQKADKLHTALMAANKKAKITEKPPSEEQVVSWIEQAKKLKIILR